MLYDRVMNIRDSLLSILDRFIFNEQCISCNMPGLAVCKKCIMSLPGPQHDLPNNIYALFEYRNKVVKKILTDAKYRNKFSGLKLFGPYLADSILEIISEYTELNNYSRIILVPVPISNKRLKKRGYNQAEIIAKNLIQNSKESYILGNKIVQKIIEKTPQASIHNKKDRLKSPIGTFKIISNKIVPQSLCIIVDDIVTTGATISELRRILIVSGAQTVIGLTIAH